MKTRLIGLGLLALAFLMSGLTRQGEVLSAEFSARTAPVLGIPYRLGQNLHQALSDLARRNRLEEEVRNLQQEIERLRQENLNLSLQVQELSAVTKIQAAAPVGVETVAPVIEQNLTGLDRTLILGKGYTSGLQVGMPVAAPAGLVGVITAVTAHQAVVRTLLDPNSVIGVRLADGPGLGIARGDPPDALEAEFPPEVSLHLGEPVVSWALRGLFPNGILVGTIAKIPPLPPGALTQTVILKPAVQFSLLQAVVVLRPL
jgi:rod shape-determining protein MreC